MRRLILMRHAKSKWNTRASDDRVRPLKGRGRRDAPRVGAKLAELGWVPDHIVSSDAARTVETCALMREPLGYGGDTEYLADLYGGELADIRRAVAALPDELMTVMAVGHNPGWEDAVAALTGEHHPIKTACAALLYREADTWAEAMEGDGAWSVETVIYPRELP